jgi:hypothetical protein
MMAATVPLPHSPSTTELFNPGFLPPLADRLRLARACAEINELV